MSEAEDLCQVVPHGQRHLVVTSYYGGLERTQVAASARPTPFKIDSIIVLEIVVPVILLFYFYFFKLRTKKKKTLLKQINKF